MSIGEVANLYRDHELVIRPEFQRLFRWTLSQKSRLIESVLLGIPLPSVFIMQRDDGVWEVIDGLQRLSTLLEFMGELRDEESGEVCQPSSLLGTKYLPSLEGLRYEADNSNDPDLSPGQRIAFKRSKLDFKILLPESDERAKFELFDRLNSGGEPPSSQEIRNCLIIMQDRSAFEWLDGLRGGVIFQNCTPLSDRQISEQYDMELVCRFFSIRESSDIELREMRNVDEFITSKILGISADPTFDREQAEDVFVRVFELLQGALEDNSFRRFDAERRRWAGGFSVSAFEAVTSGISSNLSSWEQKNPNIVSRELGETVQGLWSQQTFRDKARGGVRGTSRIPAVVPFAREYFSG